MNTRFETKLLRNRREKDSASSPSIVPASTFNVGDIDTVQNWYYSRMGNPTRNLIEDLAAELEFGIRGFAFPSGMAAIHTALTLFNSGDHVIASHDIYGGTYSLLTGVLSKYNIRVTFVDTSDPVQVERAITSETRAILIETPSNPLLKITDLRKIASIANAYNIISIADNTFMTPYLQNPLSLGFDLVIHSATKFLGGHCDIMAGLIVVKNRELAEEIAHLQMIMGNILAPIDSWLLVRSIKTLKARMDICQHSASIIAQYLSDHSKVKKVYYPGLNGHEGADIHYAQARGPGAVLSFDMGSEERAKSLLSGIRYPLVAVSLGGVESILSYPRIMSHSSMSTEEQLKRGIGPGLLRFSVGLEAYEDLIDDFDLALNEV